MSNKVHIFVQTYESGAPFFERCLKSVQNQSYANFKCYIFDNCSSEKTRELIREYIKGDDRFVIKYINGTPRFDIIFKEGHYDIAANLSDDDYVTSIDADDELHKDFLKITVALANKYKSDMVCTSSFFANNDTGEIMGIRKPDKDYFVTGAQIGDIFPQIHQIMRTHWGKLLNASTFLKMNVSNLTIPGYGSDTMYVREALSRSDSVYITSEPLYIYYVYNNTRTYTFDKGRILSPQILYNRDIHFLLEKTGVVSNINRDFLLNVFFAETSEILKKLVAGQIETNDILDGIREIIFAEPTRLICQCGNSSHYSYIGDWLCQQHYPLDSNELQLAGKIMGMICYIPTSSTQDSKAVYFKLLTYVYKYWDGNSRKQITEKILECTNNEILANTDIYFRLEYSNVVADILSEQYQQAICVIKEELTEIQQYEERGIMLYETGLCLASILSLENDFIEIKKQEIEYCLNIPSMHNVAVNELSEWLDILPEDAFLISLKNMDLCN